MLVTLVGATFEASVGLVHGARGMVGLVGARHFFLALFSWGRPQAFCARLACWRVCLLYMGGYKYPFIHLCINMSPKFWLTLPVFG